MPELFLRAALVKTVLVCPLIVGVAKVFDDGGFATKTGGMRLGRQGQALEYLKNRLRGVSKWLGVVVGLYMLGVVSEKLKVLYSIVSCYPVLVVDSLARREWSAQVLFHHITMLKYTFAIYVDANISTWGKRWLVRLLAFWIGGKFVTAMSEHSGPMHLTDKATRFSQWPTATFNLTRPYLLSFIHVFDYNTRVKDCQ